MPGRASCVSIRAKTCLRVQNLPILRANISFMQLTAGKIQVAAKEIKCLLDLLSGLFNMWTAFLYGAGCAASETGTTLAGSSNKVRALLLPGVRSRERGRGTPASTPSIVRPYLNGDREAGIAATFVSMTLPAAIFRDDPLTTSLVVNCLVSGEEFVLCSICCKNNSTAALPISAIG